MPDFPTAVPDIPNASPSETLFTMHGGASHVTATNRILTNLQALAAKLGLGSSAPGASAGVLRRTASGQSAWGPVVNADVDAAAAIAYGKLALGSSIVTADLAANAATQIAMSVGSTSNPITTAPTFAPLQGNGPSSELRVDLTTQAGGVVLVLMAVTSANSGTNANIFALALDGAAEVGNQRYVAPGAAYLGTVACVYLFTGLAAATHAFRGRWQTTAGTATANGTERVLIAMELKR